jgi:Ca-activated chloride channel family protein
VAKAREALRLSTQPPATPEVRAAGYYNLGIAFYKEADKSAGAEQHDEAQKGFREAADAFKQSLRLHPADRNAAWNYELARRRVQEQEQKQKEKQEQQKQDQQNQDQQQQSQDQQQNQDQQNQDQQQQSQDQQQQQQDQQQAQQDQPKQDQQQQPQQPSEEGQPEPAQARPEMDKALDALQEGEDNLERMRAMQRAARERRKPEKDW